MRRFLLTTIVTILGLASIDAAAADRGVALDLGRLDIAQALTPGGGYQLPPIGVRNPGDEMTSYRVVVSSVHGQSGKPIPGTWIRVEPRELTLMPGKTRKVLARLSLPTGADPGDYEGLLAAQIVTHGEGAQVGAAAAAKVTFSVEASTLLGAWWYRIRTSFSDLAPWSWLVPSIVAMALLSLQLRSRFSFKVERRA